MIEIVLATFQNFQCLMTGVLILAGIAGLFAIVGCAVGGIDAEKATKHLKTVAKVIAFPALICMVPGPKDLIKIRIALIGYHLSSPENIQKSAEVIERIGEKLECKYLGCEENKASASTRKAGE